MMEFWNDTHMNTSSEETWKGMGKFDLKQNTAKG